MKRIYEKKDGAIALVKDVSDYTKYVYGQTNGNLPDINQLDYFMPYFLAIGEEQRLSSETFMQIINDRWIVYKQLRDDCKEVFATAEEVLNNLIILDDVEEYLEMVTKWDYDIIEFEDEKFVRVINDCVCPEPKNILHSQKIRQMISERFDDSVYVIMSARGKLIIFSSNDDLVKTILKVVQHKLDLLQEDPFIVISIFKS